MNFSKTNFYLLERKKLALIPSPLRENPSQKYKFEQYSITPDIAATTLIVASKDIKGKAVYDLGCGVEGSPSVLLYWEQKGFWCRQ